MIYVENRSKCKKNTRDTRDTWRIEASVKIILVIRGIRGEKKKEGAEKKSLQTMVKALFVP